MNIIILIAVLVTAGVLTITLAVVIARTRKKENDSVLKAIEKLHGRVDDIMTTSGMRFNTIDKDIKSYSKSVKDISGMIDGKDVIGWMWRADCSIKELTRTINAIQKDEKRGKRFYLSEDLTPSLQEETSISAEEIPEELEAPPEEIIVDLDDEYVPTTMDEVCALGVRYLLGEYWTGSYPTMSSVASKLGLSYDYLRVGLKAAERLGYVTTIRNSVGVVLDAQLTDIGDKFVDGVGYDELALNLSRTTSLMMTYG